MVPSALVTASVAPYRAAEGASRCGLSISSSDRSSLSRAICHLNFEGIPVDSRCKRRHYTCIHIYCIHTYPRVPGEYDKEYAMNQTLNEAEPVEMTSPRGRGLLKATGMSLAAGLVTVTIVFVVADAATDNLLVTPVGGDVAEEIGLGVVLFMAVIGAVAGMGLAWIIGRFAPRPRATFLAVTLIGLVLFGIVPFTAAEETTTAVWLNLLHIAVAIPVIGGLAARLPDTRV